jgi:hypothetical protein
MNSEMQAFFAAVQQGKSTDVIVRDGVRSTLDCLRMMQAARDGVACAIDIDNFLAFPSR